MTDLIECYPGALASSTCKALIDIFERSGLAEQSNIISAQGSALEHQVRRSRGLILSPENCGEHYAAVTSAFRNAYMSYREKYRILQQINQVVTEAFTMVRYQGDTEHYGWHVDGADPGSRYRFLSGVCYLNTVAKGGETEFRLQTKKISPREGAILMFPSVWTHEHRGLAPASGSKYIITTWLRFADYPAL